MAQHCIHCGSAHRPAAKVCPTCGREIASDDAATRATPGVPGALVPPSEPRWVDDTRADPIVPASIATPGPRHEPTAVHRTGPPPPPPRYDRPVRRRPSPAVAVAAVGLVLAVGVGAYVATNGSGDGGGSPGTTIAGETPTRLVPAVVTASAERTSVNLRCTGEEITYTADKLVDDDEDTGWGAGQDDGTGESIVIDFGASVRITAIAMTPGYTKFGPREDTDCMPVDAFPRNRFVPRVRYTFDDGSSLVQTFEAVGDLQSIPVDIVTTTVTMTILETVLPAGADDDTIISELQFTGVAG